MFGNIINCLLDPVSNELKKKSNMHRAQEKDLMPGLIAGGGGSQGNASASPSLDSPTNCLRDTTQLKLTNARRLPPAKNSTSCANKKTCDVIPPSFVSGENSYFNPDFPLTKTGLLQRSLSKGTKPIVMGKYPSIFGYYTYCSAIYSVMLFL